MSIRLGVARALLRVAGALDRLYARHDFWAELEWCEWGLGVTIEFCFHRLYIPRDITLSFGPVHLRYHRNRLVGDPV